MRFLQRNSLRRGVKVLVYALAPMLAGCATGLGDLPLPAPGQVGDAITVTAVFSNAMNLPAKAKVKLNGADIGEVEAITAQDFTARVTLRLDAGVPLYTGTSAELRSATPLGDIFVAVRQGASSTSGARRLRDGDTIALSATSSAASVEEVLSSAALLVNGGAVRRLVTVINGAGDAVGGRGQKVADLLAESNTLVSRLSARSEEIDRALRGTSDLAATLASRRDSLDAGLSAAAPAFAVLDENAAQLVDLADGIARITQQLNRFPSMQGTDTRSMIADLNTLAAEFNTMANDPWVNVNTWNRVIAMLNKIASGPNIHAVADVSQLALGALPDLNYPGDPQFHGADGTDWHAMIGSLRYSWNLLLSNIYGPQHAPR